MMNIIDGSVTHLESRPVAENEIRRMATRMKAKRRLKEYNWVMDEGNNSNAIRC